MPDNPDRPQKIDAKIGDAELAYIDDLTGLHNRRYLNLALPRELANTKDKKGVLSLFMIDFDDFKAINDTYGHLNGDKILVDISNILKKEIGCEGMFVRYAGDEFTVILSEKTLEEAISIGAGFLRAISAYKLELKSGSRLPNISFSMGLAVYPEDADTAENLIDKADQALYTAKRMGKNRLAMAKDIALEAKDRDMAVNALPCRKLVGREKESGILKKFYDSAGDGARKYAIIKGASGIGKTRLLFDVFDPAKPGPKPLVLKCRKETMYQKFAAIISALNDFLGHFEIKDAGKAEDMIFAAIIDINAQAAAGRILFLIDDIAWIDDGSSKIIERVLKDASFNSVFIIGAFSDGEDAQQETPFKRLRAREAALPPLEAIELGPLSESSSSELLRIVFAGLLMPPVWEKKIYDCSGGFPAAIEEIIKYMISRKIVYPKSGKWVLEEKLLERMPGSMNELMDNFISGLDDDTKDLLKKAAVLGGDFNIDILKTLYGKNEGELIDALDKLKEGGVLGKTAADGGIVISFVNNIIRESIYNSIRKAELQEMHRRIAGLMREYYKYEINRAYGGMKYHMEEAGEEAFPMEGGEPAASAEEIAEKPLSEKSAAIAPNVMILLRTAWLNSNLYPIDNKTRVDSIENLYGGIKAVLDNDLTITITISGDDVLANGGLVSRKKLNIMLARALASLFADYGINSITFKRGMPKKDLESLFGVLPKREGVEKAHSLAKLLKEKGIAHVKIDEVKYRKASDYRRMSGFKDGALAKSIMENPVLKELFLIGSDGVELSQKAGSSISKTIQEISKQSIDEKDKILLMLEGLNRANAELSAKDREAWDIEKKNLADLFLSMDPGLRTKMIEESGHYESEGNNFIYDILSFLGDDAAAKILKEGYSGSKSHPEELGRFLAVMMKSQSRGGTSYGKMADLFKKAGIDKEAAGNAFKIAPAEPFFEAAAREFTSAGKSEILDNRYISNLRPLIEALIIKNDKKTIEDIIGSLNEKLAVNLPAVRSSAAEGLGRVSEVLLEKELFDTAGGIISTLSLRLKTEDNFRVYVEILKDFNGIINILIQKRKMSLLAVSLSLIREEMAFMARPAEFKRYRNAVLRRALSAENMNLLLLSLVSKAGGDYTAIIENIALLNGGIVPSIAGVLAKRDEMKRDPFEIYMKKQNIAALLKKMGDDTIAAIADNIGGKKPAAAQNTAEVLGYINDIKYLPYLRQAAEHSDMEVRKAALEAIKKMPDDGAIVKTLVSIMPKEKDHVLVQKIIDIISEQADSRILPYIKNELKGKMRPDDYDMLIDKLDEKRMKKYETKRI